MAFGQGIGSLNAGAAYTIHVDDCNLGGGDAGYYGFWQGVNMNRVTVLTQGRTGLRFASCGAVINDLFEGDASVGTDAGIMIHYGQYGGQFTITNFIYDNELNYGPSMAAIVCEGSDIAPPYFRIENLAIGVLPDNAVGIWLKDATGGINNYLSPAWNAPPRDLIVDGYSVYGSNHTAQIRTDGTLWHGTVDNFQLAYGGFTTLESVPMFDHTGPGGVGRIVHRSREYSMPPRNGKWDTGGHILEMQLPQPGQYATLRCVRTGTMNTATPPLWNGAEPIGSEFDSLGGYLVDHSYWAPVALS